MAKSKSEPKPTEAEEPEKVRSLYDEWDDDQEEDLRIRPSRPKGEVEPRKEPRKKERVRRRPREEVFP